MCGQGAHGGHVDVNAKKLQAVCTSSGMHKRGGMVAQESAWECVQPAAGVGNCERVVNPSGWTWT